MKSWILYAAAVAAVMAVAAVYTAFADSGGQNVRNIEFLASYGWETGGRYIEKEKVVLPKNLDAVYENYNRLQKEAGLDIEPYLGQECVRYTYEVKNYPDKSETGVRANLLCCGEVIIAGDIMTTRLDGFMISLAGS